MASQYSEDIGYIKAKMDAMHDDMKELKLTSNAQQTSIDSLLADAAFRRQLRKWGRTFVFICGAIATLKFGDIKGLF